MEYTIAVICDCLTALSDCASRRCGDNTIGPCVRLIQLVKRKTGGRKFLSNNMS